MSPIRALGQIFVLSACVCSLSAIAAPATTEFKTTIRIVDDFMIVVPVRINGSGPYDFLLDTGSNHTILDQKLTEELALRRGDQTPIVGVWGSVTSSAVFADSFSIAGATVPGKDLVLFSYAEIRGLPPKVRGVLGEDFFQKFDILIDYRHQVIRLETGPGLMVEMLRGEHLPIQLDGMMSGRQTLGRLIVTGQVKGLGDNSISLLLDSGSKEFTLFREDLGKGSEWHTFVDPSRPKSSSVTRLETRTVRSLKLGSSEISNIMVIAIAGKQRPDVDGFMPTSLFRSIFISHQGKFVILNPSFAKAPAEDVRSRLAAKPLVIPPDLAEMSPPIGR